MLKLGWLWRYFGMLQGRHIGILGIYLAFQSILWLNFVILYLDSAIPDALSAIDGTHIRIVAQPD
jgi:hypothetical protein